MALTPEQIDAEAFARWGEMKGAPLAMCRGFARAIEAEVRKDDEALIRHLLSAVESAMVWKSKDLHRISREITYEPAIAAARARLEKAP